MEKRFVYCDHCGKVLDPEEMAYNDAEITMGPYWEKVDLCPRCMGHLICIVEQFLSGEEFANIGKEE